MAQLTGSTGDRGIEARIARLEQQHERLKRAVVLGFCAFGVFAVWHWLPLLRFPLGIAAIVVGGLIIGIGFIRSMQIVITRILG